MVRTAGQDRKIMVYVIECNQPQQKALKKEEIAILTLNDII